MSRVLVACEFSGRVRDAFLRAGHDAWSCDILPTEAPGPHIQGRVEAVLKDGWDLLVAHPPCTDLANSGAQHFRAKRDNGQQQRAIRFVRLLLNAPIPRIVVENPVGMISTFIRRPDQIVQPWMFGDEEVKTTCLWLKGLPKLVPTNVVDRRESKILLASGTIFRWKGRSRTYQGVADAMAAQWGPLLSMPPLPAVKAPQKPPRVKRLWRDRPGRESGYHPPGRGGGGETSSGPAR